MSSEIDNYVEGMPEDFALREFITINKEVLSTPIHLLKALGDIELAVVVGQILYWYGKTNHTGFYKTDESFREEFYLSERSWKTIKSKLKKVEFLEIKSKGVPAKTFYNIDIKKYLKTILEYKNI